MPLVDTTKPRTQLRLRVAAVIVQMCVRQGDVQGIAHEEKGLPLWAWQDAFDNFTDKANVMEPRVVLNPTIALRMGPNHVNMYSDEDWIAHAEIEGHAKNYWNIIADHYTFPEWRE